MLDISATYVITLHEKVSELRESKSEREKERRKSSGEINASESFLQPSVLLRIIRLRLVNYMIMSAIVTADNFYQCSLSFFGLQFIHEGLHKVK